MRLRQITGNSLKSGSTGTLVWAWTWRPLHNRFDRPMGFQSKKWASGIPWGILRRKKSRSRNVGRIARKGARYCRRVSNLVAHPRESNWRSCGAVVQRGLDSGQARRIGAFSPTLDRDEKQKGPGTFKGRPVDRVLPNPLINVWARATGRASGLGYACGIFRHSEATGLWLCRRCLRFLDTQEVVPWRIWRVFAGVFSPSGGRHSLKAVISLPASPASMRSSTRPSRRADFPARASWRRQRTDRFCSPRSAAWIGH